jgi:hypothetical protein
MMMMTPTTYYLTASLCSNALYSNVFPASCGFTTLQVWYDNPASLALKYRIAADHGLKGIGFWNLDCLDYSSKDALVQQQTREMWAAVGSAVAAFSDSMPLS